MYCIYHSRDFDGFASGAIVKKAYPDCIMIGYDYGQEIPMDEIKPGQPIIMVDVSVPMEKMVELALHSGRNFTWIDHHKSAIEDYLKFQKENRVHASFITAVLQEGIAACEITWSHLFPDLEMPLPIALLGTYDTWRDSNKHYWNMAVLPFQYGLKLADIQSAEDFPQSLLSNDKEYINSFVNNIIKDGAIALTYQRSMDKIIMQQAFEVEFAGLRGIACNGSGFGSMAFDSVPNLDQYDFMMPFKFDGKQWVFSLYTAKDNIDCSELAKMYGGGGHKKAAGFISNELLDFISKHYTIDPKKTIA